MGKISIPKFLKWPIRIALWIIGGFIILFISLSLLLLIPSVQKFVVDKATNFLTTKTKMKADVGSVHIGFPKTIKIGDIYIEDLGKDTLFYCQQISINADLIPLLNQKINIDYLLIEDLKGNVLKNSHDSSFNFSPLIEAFSSNKPKEKKSDINWQIGFNELALNNINLSYYSQIDSSFIKLILGNLIIKDNSSDILKQEINLKSIELGQTSLSLMIGDKQKKNSVSSTPKESTVIPLTIKLDDLNVEDMLFNLEFTSGKLGLSAKVKDANLKPDVVDLSSQQIKLKEILADDIMVALNIKSNPEDTTIISSNLEPTSPLPDYTFGNFDWNFYVDHAEITNTAYIMNLNEQPRLPAGMDYMHMDFSNFNVVADSLYFNKDKTGASVSSLSVTEISGPEVRDVKGIFSMDNQHILARDIFMTTPLSHIDGSVALSYPAMRLIGKEISQFGIESRLKGKIQISEITPFTSVLDDYPILKNFKSVEVKEFVSEGVLGNIHIKQADIGIFNSTFTSLSASIKGLPSTDLRITYQMDTLITCKNDLSSIIPDSLMPDQLELPETIGLKSSGETNLIDGNTIIDLVTDIGQMHMDANLTEGIITSTINLNDFDLGSALNDTIYGAINLQTQINGVINDNSIKSITSKSELSSAFYNGYTYKNGNVSLDWSDDKLVFEANLSDTSLSASINGNIYEKDSVNHFNVFLDLEKSNLHHLNLVDEDFSVSGKVNVDMDIKSQVDFKGVINAEDIQLGKLDNSFHIDALSFETDLNEDYTNFNFRSEIADAKLTGNTKLNEIKDAIIDHLDLYITLPDSIVSEKDFEFEFSMDLKNPDLFTEFLIKDLKEIKLDKCFMKYNDKADILEADIIIPNLIYNNMEFQGLSFFIDSKSDEATARLALNSLSYDSASIHNLQLHSFFESEQAELSFTIHDLMDSLKYQMITQLYYKDSIYKMILAPDQTIINYEKWKIPESNYLQIVDGKFSVESTQMSNRDQKLTLEAIDNIIHVEFDNFELGNISNIIEYDTIVSTINGKIIGFTELIDPFTQPKVNAEINIPDLTLKDNFLGELSLTYSTVLDHKFDFKLQNGNNYIYASGNKSKSTDNLNLILESNIKNATVFQPLTKNYVKNLGGAINGRLSIVENNDDLLMNGKFEIDDLKLSISSTNTQLSQSGQIFIENNIVQFQSYVIRDSLKNAFSIRR